MIRAFVSIRVPDTPAIEGLRADLRAAGLRPSSPEQTHITIRFIGDLEESRVDELISCVHRAAEGTGPFLLSVSGIGAFPNERRPSVVWMGASPGDVMGGIAVRLGTELRAAGIGFDTKPFRPHVTVARVRDGHVPARVFEGYRDTLFSECECAELLVMSSVLGRGGARHSVLARVPLIG